MPEVATLKISRIVLDAFNRFRVPVLSFVEWTGKDIYWSFVGLSLRRIVIEISLGQCSLSCSTGSTVHISDEVLRELEYVLF
jgi:hypothetical protein